MTASDLSSLRNQSKNKSELLAPISPFQSDIRGGRRRAVR